MPRVLILPLLLVLTLATGAVALAVAAVVASPWSPVALGSGNDAVVRRFYAALNEAIRTGEVAPLDALLSPAFADHPAPADGSPARAAFLQTVLALHAASPDLQIEVETVAAAGETVTVRGHLRRAGIGGAPATAIAGPAAIIGRVDVFRVEGGKIAEHWGIGDAAARCGAQTTHGAGMSAVGSVSLGASLAPSGPLWTGLGSAPRPQWQVHNIAVSAEPVVANGTVYAVGWDRVLFALDAATGAEHWRFATGDQVYAPPVVNDGTVYVVSAGGIVQALDATTGLERWQSRAAGSVGRGLSLADGTLYLATGTAPLPAVAGGVVYAARGEQGAILQAFNAGTGTERWRLALAARSLSAIETANVHTRWRLPLNGNVVSAVVLDGGSIYVAANGLTRIDAATGRAAWHVDGSTVPRASPAVADGLVYRAETDGRLRAIEAETGVERSVIDTAGMVVSSPIVADGVVYLGSRDGNLYAVDAPSGVACGRFALGDMAHAPAVIGGVVYVGTVDGRLAAVVVGEAS